MVTVVSPMRRDARGVHSSPLLRVAVVIALLALPAATALAQSPTKDILRPDPLARHPGLYTTAPPTTGDFTPPSGAPDPTMALTAGSPSPIMRFVFDGIGSGRLGLDSMALPDSAASGPFATSGSDVVTSSMDEAGGTLPLLANGAAAQATVAAHRDRRRDRPVCFDDYTEAQLQNGGEFWTPQARSAAPSQFPAAVFTSDRLGSRDPVALGPTGHPVNLPATGPAGSWCRPPPVPMSQSSPLATRAFWIVVLFPTGVFVVFWLSRGIRLRAIHEP